MLPAPCSVHELMMSLITMCMCRFWSTGPPGWGQRRISGARLHLSLILHPQSCAGSQGSRRNLGRDCNGLRLRPELKPQGGAQISGANSGSSLTWVQSAPLAQKQRKKENRGGGKRQKDKECTLLASVNMSRNCFNIFTMFVLKEMCNKFTVYGYTGSITRLLDPSGKLLACPPLPVCLAHLLKIRSFKNDKLEEGSPTLL